MTTAARSALVHGAYASLAGLSLLVYPDGLSMIGFETNGSVFLRIFGAATTTLGFIYIRAAQQNNIPFYRSSIVSRIAFMVLLLVVMALGLAGPNVLLLGVVDVLTAIWTVVGLRDASIQTK